MLREYFRQTIWTSPPCPLAGCPGCIVRGYSFGEAEPWGAKLRFAPFSAPAWAKPQAPGGILPGVSLRLRRRSNFVSLVVCAGLCWCLVRLRRNAQPRYHPQTSRRLGLRPSRGSWGKFSARSAKVYCSAALRAPNQHDQDARQNRPGPEEKNQNLLEADNIDL